MSNHISQKDLEALRAQFIEFEGLRLKPYDCPAGYLTIGVGRNLQTNGLTYHEMLALINGNLERKIRMQNADLSDKHNLFRAIVRDMKKHGITRDEAMFLLDNDIHTVTTQCRQSIRWFDTAPAVIQEVLIDMCFNMGIKTLLTFQNTLRLMQTGKYEEAAAQMLKSKWARQVKRRAVVLSEKVKTAK